MKKFADTSAYLFIISIIILGIISILGVWDIFTHDVISKSFETIGLLALVAIIVMIADHFIEPKGEASQATVPATTENTSVSRWYVIIRKCTLTLLILSVALLALFGVMAIWGVLAGEVLSKSIASIAIAAFSSFIIVLTCLEREKNKILYKNTNPGLVVITLVIVVWLFCWGYFYIINQ